MDKSWKCMNIKYLSRLKQPVFVATFVLMLLAMCWQTVMHLIDYANGVHGYTNGCVNDMLVNYEGGFVRRGLFGELLFLARSIVPFSVIDAIVVIYYVGVALLAALLVIIFRRNGWSLYLLPFPVCLYVYLCDPYFLVGRRDCWLLMLAYLCFFLYHKYVVYRWGGGYLIGCVAVQLFALLLHEASLFFIFPIIAAHDLSRQYTRFSSLIKAFLKCASHWWPIVTVALSLVTYHGNQGVVRDFWMSWAPYFDVTEDLITNSYVSRAMNDSFFYNMTMKLWPVSWQSSIAWGIPVWPFNLYLFACTYYLVTRFDTIRLLTKKRVNVDKVQLSNIVLTLFCSMIVFMSIVSCDWGRDFAYWVIASFMFFCFFGTTGDFPEFLTILSGKLQGWIDRSRFLKSQWGYYLLLITLPLSFMSAGISAMFPFIPLALKHILMGQPMVI